MSLSIPVVWSEAQSLHRPESEVWVGVDTPAAEVPARAERIRAALVEAGSGVVVAAAHPDDELLAVHDRELVEYLAGAWREWERAGLTRDPGQHRVIPYIFPVPG